MKTILSKLLIAVSVLGLCLQAKATITVALEPSSQTVNLGDTTFVDLVISGLGDHAPPSLGGFLFDLSYAPGILSAVSVSFGSHLDLGIVGSVQTSDISTAGTIHVDEISLESPSDLEANQPSSFTLATLGFKGVGSGTSLIDITFGSLADETGAVSLEFSTQGAQIDVAGAAVVPDSGSTVTWLAMSVLGLLVLRRSAVVTFRPVHLFRR
jgi:hypothetical protein